jgi:hypothetical protein
VFGNIHFDEHNCPVMKTFVFRFFLLYFILILDLSPFSWLNDLPGFSSVTDLYFQGESYLVHVFNEQIFHIKDELNVNGMGSGDTSYAWARFFTIIAVSFLLAFFWTLIDRKQRNYASTTYVLRSVLRYYIALVAFSYGIIKVFALQMPFPNLSQLATPLGDFLPMRLSWMFIGYSKPYQIFSGVMEVLVCVLLINRKTVTAGLLLGLAVFLNIFILNMSYDIPVKLYSFQLFLTCAYLIAEDGKRLVGIFLMNRSAGENDLYRNKFSFRHYNLVRFSAKVLFILLFMLLPAWEAWSRYQRIINMNLNMPPYAGYYKLDRLLLNGDAVPVNQYDANIWKDLILDKGNMGSIQSTNTSFNQRYGRGYFGYSIDSLSQQISFTRSAFDTTRLFILKFKFSDSVRLQLWGKVHDDSVNYSFIKSKRHFQLTEQQFHWISEANR